MYNETNKHGILNDYNLAHWATQRRPTGMEHTGTRLFMVLDLLTDEAWDGKVERLYCHDCESFVWVLLWVCCHYKGGCKGTSAHFLTFPLFSSTLLYSPLFTHTHPCSYVHSPTLCTITRCQTLNANDSRTSKMSTCTLINDYCHRHPTLPLRSYL
jgi:hypothetical protein